MAHTACVIMGCVIFSPGCFQVNPGHVPVPKVAEESIRTRARKTVTAERAGSERRAVSAG